MCVVCQHFQTSSPLKPLGRLKPNFIWSLLGTQEWKFVQMVQVTWPRWAPCPYMVKTLKNLLLRNQKADDLDTWYAALGARVLPILFKWWPWVDLDLFYGKVKFGPLCFCNGFGWLCWGLTSQSTIFQSCRDGAIASWVINQYFRGVKCLAQGHNKVSKPLAGPTLYHWATALPTLL